jgi:hypothetical protein
MNNSYKNFLKLLLSMAADAALEFLLNLRTTHSGPVSLAVQMSVNAEEVHLENQLRTALGKRQWSSESLRELFCHAQPSLPAYYESLAAKSAATVQAVSVSGALNYGGWLAWGGRNVGVLLVIGDAATRLPAAKTYVARWEIVKPVGDAVAPAIDDLFLPTALGGDVLAMEADLLKAVNAVPQALAGKPRDGRWLRVGFELFKTMLPILLQPK